MKLIPIFGEENGFAEGGLLAIKFTSEKDEYNKFFEKWSDTAFLQSFFKENSQDLFAGFYGDITIDEAIDKTLDEFDFLMSEIYSLIQMNAKNKNNNLGNLFKPLNDLEYKDIALQESKAKALIRKIKKPWLRIYAIKLNNNLFIITGGTIKLTKTMNERLHTLEELEKSKKTLSFLKSKDIFSHDDLIYYYENIE